MYGLVLCLDTAKEWYAEDLTKELFRSRTENRRTKSWLKARATKFVF